MKTMSDYTIPCNPEQTRKALELGAPISPKFHKVKDIYGNYSYEIEEKDGEPVLEIPTAEQILGWLRQKGFRFKIVEHESDVYWQYVIDDYFDHNIESSAKEAALAAIDAALEYLSKHKE